MGKQPYLTPHISSTTADFKYTYKPRGLSSIIIHKYELQYAYSLSYCVASLLFSIGVLFTPCYVGGGREGQAKLCFNQKITFGQNALFMKQVWHLASPNDVLLLCLSWLKGDSK